MKRTNRELNVFGMSALDLFASGLGAFILISIIIFPLIADQSAAPTPESAFAGVAAPSAEPALMPICPELPAPVPCPVCPVAVPVADVPPPPLPAVQPAPTPAEPVDCPVCPPVPEPEPCPAVPATTQSGYQLPHLDLVIALDITSSMGPQVASLKTEVEQLSELLSRMAPSFGVGLVAFGDRNWERPTITFALRQISGPTVNRAAFRGFVNGLAVRAGLGRGTNNDPPEAFAQALTDATRMPWRAEAQRRVIVLVTDNPAYPEEQDLAVALAASVGRMPGHRVSTVYVNSQGFADPETESFLRRVAIAGGGQYVQDAGGSITVNLLLSLL